MYVIFAFILSAAIYGAEENVTDVPLILTDKTFESTIAQRNTLVVLYVTWCPHCKRLLPEFKAAAELLKGNQSVQLAQINCEENKDACKKHVKGGYPTVLFFKGQEIIPYDGPRTSAGIKSWLDVNLRPTVFDAHSIDEAKTYAKQFEQALIGTFQSDKAPEYKKLFEHASSTRSKTIVRIAVINPSVKKPSLEFYHTKIDISEAGPSFSEVGANWDKENIKEFENAHSPPFYYDDPFSNQLRELQTETKAKAVLFYDPDYELKQQTDAFFEVAKKYRGKIGFALANKNIHSKKTSHFNLGSEIYPSFAIEAPIEWSGLEEWNKKKEQEKKELNTQQTTKTSKLQDTSLLPFFKSHFVLPTKNTGSHVTIKSDQMASFIDQFLNGKIERSMRSSDLPPRANSPFSPVLQLVGKSFSKFAFDPTKSVLIRITTPSCQLCEKTRPIYRRLATDIKEIIESKSATATSDSKAFAEQFIVAEIDVDENDLPAEATVLVEDIPDILLFQAVSSSDQNTPKRISSYSGPMTYEKIKRFLRDEFKSTNLPAFPLEISQHVIEDEDEIDALANTTPDKQVDPPKPQPPKKQPPKPATEKKEEKKDGGKGLFGKKK